MSQPTYMFVVSSFIGTPISRLPQTCSTSRPFPFKMTLTSSDSLPFPQRVSRAVVWFREGDLRIQDHPGLEAACAHTSEALAPLLVCTPRTSDEFLQAAIRLDNDLRKRGSSLVLRYAEKEADAVINFLREYGAERVHVRMDIEEEARKIVHQVERAVDGETRVSTWTDDLRDWNENDPNFLTDIPENYPKFRRWLDKTNLTVKRSTVEFQPDVIVPGPQLDASNLSENIDETRTVIVNSRKPLKTSFLERVAIDDEKARCIKLDVTKDQYGELAIREFLKNSDAYQDPDLGRSLAEVFTQGALSPRRIYEIVHNHEKENGRLFPFLYRSGAKLLLNLIEAKEFSTLLARKDLALSNTVDGKYKPKFWRWRGYLTRYVEAGIENANNGKPPLLLIHGFGASAQHFRRSIPLLEKKYHVFAIDLIGFGRAEKPSMQYTQDLWERFIWDFVDDVIGKPVFVAGNSIGGYLSMAFGADAYPELCSGVCLVNSAGKLEQPGKPTNTSSSQRGLFKYVLENSRPIRMLVGNILLQSLQGRVQKTLKLVYPSNPEAADEALATEILRNSQDYGASEVIASGFNLPVPRSLSKLLKDYSGPLLVFQGELDPLNNARDRVETIEAQYPEATVTRVNAGHCPHEEDAEGFVDTISKWMDSLAETPVMTNSNVEDEVRQSVR